MTPEQAKYQALIMAAPNPHGLATLAFAGVIAAQARRPPPYNVPVAGLSREALQSLKERHFPKAAIELDAQKTDKQNLVRADEFDDLLALLMENATKDNEETRWVAHAIATASMAKSHLWEDMGLPSRAELSELLLTYFRPLARRNTGDMKWKKFFYRALCEREGLNLCRAPSCGACNDYSQCFSPEEPTSDAVFFLKKT